MGDYSNYIVPIGLVLLGLKISEKFGLFNDSFSNENANIKDFLTTSSNSTIENYKEIISDRNKEIIKEGFSSGIVNLPSVISNIKQTSQDKIIKEILPQTLNQNSGKIGTSKVYIDTSKSKPISDLKLTSSQVKKAVLLPKSEPIIINKAETKKTTILDKLKGGILSNLIKR